MSPSAIEWTDETWNPTVGCSRVSPGCDHCYAIGVAHRAMQPAHVGLTTKAERGLDWTGEVRLLPDRLETPFSWAESRMVFVDSMSDLFHPEILRAEGDPPFLAEVFAVMAATKRHTYQVLTKRPQAMAAVLAHPRFRLDVNAILLRRGVSVMRGGFESPWPENIWLGTSIESDKYAWRADHLRATPAALRFLSLEPLLGPLPSLDLTGIDWVIVGGESGPGARPMHPDWARDIRDRCAAASIPFFFKQWGEWLPLNGHREFLDLPAGQRKWVSLGEEAMVHVGKKAAGRELDGRTWTEQPKGALA